MSNSTNMGWKKWRFLKVSTNSSNYSSSHKNMMLMKRNCTSGYMYVAAFGGSAVLKLSVGMLVFVRILGDIVWGLGAYFSGASRSFQGVYHCQNICQCQWIFLMKPRMFRLGTFWPYCRWIHLHILSILMVNSPVYWLQMIEMNMRPTSCVFHHVPWDSETFKLRILTGKLFPEMPIIKDGHCLYRSDFSCNVPWRWVRRHQWWILLQGGRDDVSIEI